MSIVGYIFITAGVVAVGASLSRITHLYQQRAGALAEKVVFHIGFMVLMGTLSYFGAWRDWTFQHPYVRYGRTIAYGTYSSTNTMGVVTAIGICLGGGLLICARLMNRHRVNHGEPGAYFDTDD